jgi:hypothetical protein
MMQMPLIFHGKWLSPMLAEPGAPLALPAGDVASSLARIDLQLGRDHDDEPDPLRAPPSRGLRIWCSEE